MDVTPQILHDVEFRSKVRGYDPDEVDDFLERVAVAVGDLQTRLRDAIDRADAADVRATQVEQENRGRDIESDETLRRTLVLAQRTADAAIKEAEETAAQTIGAAEEHVGRLLADADEKATRVVADADAEARRVADEARQRLAEEIIALEGARDGLRLDVTLLERHLDEQRLRLRTSLTDLQRLVDDPGGFRVAPPPPLSGITSAALLVSTPEPAVEPEPEPDIPTADIRFDAGDIDAEMPSVAGAAAEHVEVGEFAADPPAAPASFDAPPADPALAGVAPDDGGATVDAFDAALPGIDLTAAPVTPASDPLVAPLPPSSGLNERLGVFDGPSTQAVPHVDADDAYLNELRKAMLQDTGALTEPGIFDQDDPADPHRARQRFGRRR